MSTDIDIYRVLPLLGVSIAGTFATCYALLRGKLGETFRRIDDCDSAKACCEAVRVAESVVTENYRKVIMERFDKLEQKIDTNFKYLLDKIIELKGV